MGIVNTAKPVFRDCSGFETLKFQVSSFKFQVPNIGSQFLELELLLA